MKRVALAAFFAVAPLQAASLCRGTPADGSLQGGVSLPLAGENFRAYSTLGWMLGRAHVHDRVRAALLDAWKTLETERPGVVYVYGETGWPTGGRFHPHRTHRNGTSVDLMVPVRRGDATAQLPTRADNRFGYGVEFDAQGRAGDLRIDFDAMAEQLHALHGAAKRNGIGIARVIFDPPLLPRLWRTKHGAWLRRSIAFMPRAAWIRHDEHYHVDFAVHCAGR
jgi:penicillin-insensitive murein endopeptidase